MNIELVQDFETVVEVFYCPENLKHQAGVFFFTECPPGCKHQSFK